MHEISMIDSFQYQGDWWLPDHPEMKVSGVLKFTPTEGAILELSGSFPNYSVMRVRYGLDIILGEATGGKLVTLQKCTEMRWADGLHTFFCKTLYLGAHFPREEDIRFNSMEVRFPNLDEWIGISGFDVPPPSSEGWLVKYRSIRPISVDIAGLMHLSLNFRSTISCPTVANYEASIKQSASMSILFPLEKAIQECWDILFKIRCFLCLGMSKPVHSLSLQGRINSMRHCHNQTIDICWQLPHVPDMKTLG